MNFRLRRIWVVFAVVSVLTGFVQAETYHLGNDNSWKNAADTPDGKYLLAVSKIKRQLETGTQADVVDALETLKADFPEIAGAEIDSYLEAEKLYADLKWYKAATAYKGFIDAWPESVLRPAAMKRVYSIGTAFLQGEKRTFFKVLKFRSFDTGVSLMEGLADQAGNAPIALEALMTLAENQERKNKFMEAKLTWERIADQWPGGKTRQTATLRMAQALHASYEGAQYDAAVIAEARSHLRGYERQYEEDAKQQEVPETIALITEQLAYKEYETGFYYERTGHPEAATRSYDKVLDKWPDSKAAQMVQARLTPNAVSPVTMTPRRKAVNHVAGFLDSWFGLEPLFRSKDKSNTEE